VIKFVSLDGAGLNLADPSYCELLKWPVVGEVVVKLAATPGSVSPGMIK